MKNILILCAVMMSGCATTVPITKSFPIAPDPLLLKCEKLETINKPTVVLSELMKTVVSNYTKYHGCAELVNAWQDWYTKQKHVFDAVKKAEE